MNYDLSILFYLKKSHVNKQGFIPIFLRITVNGSRAEISTNCKVELDKWDSDLSRAKGRSAGATNLNDNLDYIRNRIKRDFNSLQENDELISTVKLKDMFLGKYKKHHFLLEVFERNNELIKKEIGIKYSKDTVERYLISIERLREFLKHEPGDDDIKLQDLNHTFMRRYDSFLRTNYQCDHNTAVKYLKHLKRVIHFSMEVGYIQFDPFYQYRTAYKEVARGYLTTEELKKIEAKTFKIARLARVRDIFVFVCYTGLAYSDLADLTASNIIKGSDGRNWLKYERNKTGVWANIPILPQAQNILDRYWADPHCVDNNKVLPIITNQKLNSYLIEIADLCGIDRHITMHMGRHTFATTVTMTNGVPIESISKMLGHTSIKTTQIYSKVVETKIARDMEDLRQKFS
jgi:site-specific recombinase XerD